jgi:transitional endoplasmic reticulum ATPase
MATRRRPLGQGNEISIISDPDKESLIRRWMLRMLVPLWGMRFFIHEHGFNDEQLADALGLKGRVGANVRKFDQAKAREQLCKLYAQEEKRNSGVCIPERVQNNVAKLAQMIGLSAVDCRILEFAVLLKTNLQLCYTSKTLGELSEVEVARTLATILRLPEQDVRRALSTYGALAQSGLLVIGSDLSMQLDEKIELISQEFAEQLVVSDADPVGLLRETIAPATPAKLTLLDYSHIDESVGVLLPYLKQALAAARAGVNVLLYGPPGTGKSQLARVLAGSIGCDLFEVVCENTYGDPIDAERRLQAFRAAQYFLAQRSTLLLFDEAEDVFDDGGPSLGRKSTAQQHKAWMNRMLERNRIPALWISNQIGCLDPAYIRRFDMVVELPIPPRSQRVRMIEESGRGLLDSGAVARLAESEALAPAIVARAVSVVQTVGSECDAMSAGSAVERVINNTLVAQGHSPIQRSLAQHLPDIYDPAFIHADADLAAVAAGLVHSTEGRLCLYGPSGTGKTAYARWLAQQLDRPLHVKRTSDLLSKWFGESEKQIAQAFRQAEAERAVLLIDEVDSLLQDRRGATHDIDVRLVNEMLTQMESFPGVFVASTNLMEGIDQAALRRFDLKVRFGYLQPEQAWKLLRRHCQMLGFKARQTERQRLERLPNLTPGDFAAVVRQNRFRALSGAGGFIAALEAECAVKDPVKHAVGFI